MKEVYYLDHCASTPLCTPAKKLMQRLIEDDPFADADARHHAAGAKPFKIIEDTRLRLAALYDLPASSVIFTSGATEANNLILTGFAMHYAGRPARIFVGATEHKSVLETAQFCRDWLDTYVTVLAVDRDGRLDLAQLAEQLKPSRTIPTLVALMHTNNEIPVRHPVEEIGMLCERFGAKFHCDAVQGVVREALRLSEIRASSAVISAHKLSGPKGLGVLLLDPSHRRLAFQPPTRGGEQERGIRPGTLNTLAIAAAGVAIVHHETVRASLLEHLSACDETFIGILAQETPGFRLTVPRDVRVPGLVSFFVEGLSANTLLSRLPNVCMSRGAACNEASSSHVPQALGMTAAQATGVLRASFGFASTIAEVRAAATLIAAQVQILRQERAAASA